MMCLAKVEQLSALREKSGHNYMIEVDGGVGPEHVDPCLNAGVDVFVAGTAYFQERRGGPNVILPESVGEKF